MTATLTVAQHRSDMLVQAAALSETHGELGRSLIQNPPLTHVAEHVNVQKTISPFRSEVLFLHSLSRKYTKTIATPHLFRHVMQPKTRALFFDSDAAATSRCWDVKRSDAEALATESKRFPNALCVRPGGAAVNVPR